MPPSFHLPHLQNFASQDSSHPRPVEALLPMAFSKGQLQEAMGDFNYFGLARLKPGVSVVQANADLNALQHTIMASLSAEDKSDYFRDADSVPAITGG
jgi:hypothetical protein